MKAKNNNNNNNTDSTKKINKRSKVDNRADTGIVMENQFDLHALRDKIEPLAQAISNKISRKRAALFEEARQKAYEQLEIKLSETNNLKERLAFIRAYDDKFYTHKEETLAAILFENPAKDLEQAIKDYTNGLISQDKLTRILIEHNEQVFNDHTEITDLDLYVSEEINQDEINQDEIKQSR